MRADQHLRKAKVRSTVVGRLIARAEANGLKFSQIAFIGRNYPNVANHLLSRNYLAAAEAYTQS